MMATQRPAPLIEKDLAEQRKQLANIERATKGLSPETKENSSAPTKAAGDKKLIEAKIAELEAELKSLGDPAP
ncbi:hypothetical protein EJI01_01370 [Variovorax sp. MHTC-1]|nr:hypothetical protein EJI01_01370 [Variovorax sp. MHTC-1]